jgi:hypothetical protein
LALQQVADRRAAALTAADPVLLLGVEPAGSAAFETDRQLIDRLRAQRQRYLDLAFTVRSAEVVSATSDELVLRAVVDRSAYRVVTDDDAEAQAAEAASGVPLRYALSLVDGAWRLTAVSPP